MVEMIVTSYNAAKFTLGQTQCQRLPHEWGLGKGITEAKSYPRRNSAETTYLFSYIFNIQVRKKSTYFYMSQRKNKYY
jgi:hypothetical protein